MQAGVSSADCMETMCVAGSSLSPAAAASQRRPTSVDQIVLRGGDLSTFRYFRRDTSAFFEYLGASAQFADTTPVPLLHQYRLPEAGGRHRDAGSAACYKT